MNKTRLPSKLKPEQVITYTDAVNRMKYISDLDQEVVLLVTMSCDSRIIDDHLISLGQMEESQLDCRILFHRILTDKAKRFIVGHNHPNGRAVFSYGDFKISARMKYISDVMGICFDDHILFAHGKDPICFSQKFPKFWGQDFFETMENQGIKPLVKYGKKFA